jgi:hypothetical protein
MNHAHNSRGQNVKRVFLFLIVAITLWVSSCRKTVEENPHPAQFPGNWQMLVSNDDVMQGTAIIAGDGEKGEMSFTFACEDIIRTFRGPYQIKDRDIEVRMSVDWFPGLTYHLDLTGTLHDDGTITGVSTYENLFGEFTGTWSAVSTKQVH